MKISISAICCCLIFLAESLASADAGLFAMFENTLKYIDPKTGAQTEVAMSSNDSFCLLGIWDTQYNAEENLIYTFHFSPPDMAVYSICVWSLQKQLAIGKLVGDLNPALPPPVDLFFFSISVHRGYLYLVVFNDDEWWLQKFNINSGSVQTLAKFDAEEWGRYGGSKTFVVDRPDAQFLLVDFHHYASSLTSVFWIDLNTGELLNYFTFPNVHPHIVGVSGDHVYGVALFIENEQQNLNEPFDKKGYLVRPGSGSNRNPRRHHRRRLRFQSTDSDVSENFIFSRSVFKLNIHLDTNKDHRLMIYPQKHYGLGLLADGSVLNGTIMYLHFVGEEDESSNLNSLDITSGNLVGQIDIDEKDEILLILVVAEI